MLIKTKGDEQMKQISLAAARVNSGLTQTEMAEKLGVSRRSVANWESGAKRMRKAHFLAFCQVTGFDTEDIFLPEKFA